MTRLFVKSTRAVCVLGLLLSACSSSHAPSVLQEIDVSLGARPVHVTYDTLSRVCSAVQSEPAVCQPVDKTPGEGVGWVRLDPARGAPFVLRMLVSPGVVFHDFPGDQMRMSVAVNTDLVMAVFERAPACFHQTDPDGQTHTVTVAATQTDTGSGVTAVASGDPAC